MHHKLFGGPSTVAWRICERRSKHWNGEKKRFCQLWLSFEVKD